MYTLQSTDQHGLDTWLAKYSCCSHWIGHSIKEDLCATHVQLSMHADAFSRCLCFTLILNKDNFISNRAGERGCVSKAFKKYIYAGQRFHYDETVSHVCVAYLILDFFTFFFFTLALLDTKEIF